MMYQIKRALYFFIKVLKLDNLFSITELNDNFINQCKFEKDQQKIQEYIHYMVSCGQTSFINNLKENYERILKELYLKQLNFKYTTKPFSYMSGIEFIENTINDLFNHLSIEDYKKMLKAKDLKIEINNSSKKIFDDIVIINFFYDGYFIAGKIKKSNRYYIISNKVNNSPYMTLKDSNFLTLENIIEYTEK